MRREKLGGAAERDLTTVVYRQELYRRDSSGGVVEIRNVVVRTEERLHLVVYR